MGTVVNSMDTLQAERLCGNSLLVRTAVSAFTGTVLDVWNRAHGDRDFRRSRCRSARE